MVSVQLILFGSQKERLNRAYEIIEKALGLSVREKGHPDLITPEPALSLGIDQIRILQKRLALKPYSAPVKVALITQAEKLTVPAQNALLKTLEEPPANTLIILLAPKKGNLLPTLISRCQITQLIQKPEIEIDENSISQYLNILISVLGSRVGEKLKLAQEFSNRQEASLLTKNLLFLWRELLLVKSGAKKKKNQELPSLRHAEFSSASLNLTQIKTAIENTEMTRIMLEANVNPRLALENLLLSYPTLPGQSWSRA